MRQKSLALFALFVASSLAAAQDGGVPEVRPFSVSSLGTPFAVQGHFEGEYRVHPGLVELRVTKAHVRVGEHCPYQGRRLLSAVRFGLAAKTDNGRWEVADWCQDFFLEHVMSPGDTLSLGELYFRIPVDDAVDLSERWLVVQMEETALDVPEEERQKGYAFAHSRRDIFTRGE
jgi:hypothetical protein